jgi:hypothetical protein
MNIDISITPLQMFYCKCKFDAHHLLREQLLEQIQNTEFNKIPTVSKVDWQVSKDREREWVKTIFPALSSYSAVMGQAAGYKDVLMEDIWFQQYVKTDIHPWHVHGQQFVGVYYLELQDSSPRTEYIEPLTDKIVKFDVEEGDIVIFPSSLTHRAPLIQDDNRKTIISWNFNFNEPILKNSGE